MSFEYISLTQARTWCRDRAGCPVSVQVGLTMSQDAGQGALLLAWLFHQHDPKTAFAVLSEARQTYRHVFVLDYRTPERNLDFVAYGPCWLWEQLSGHARAYSAYMRAGGLERIPYTLGEVPKDRKTVCFGGAGVLWF